MACAHRSRPLEHHALAGKRPGAAETGGRGLRPRQLGVGLGMQPRHIRAAPLDVRGHTEGMTRRRPSETCSDLLNRPGKKTRSD